MQPIDRYRFSSFVTPLMRFKLASGSFSREFDATKSTFIVVCIHAIQTTRI